MLRVGLNPYGLTYHLGLQARGTARENPHGTGLEGFITLAIALQVETLEIFEPWLAALSDREMGALRERLAGLGIVPVVSGGLAVAGPPESALRSAHRLGATTIRLALTPVLCGDRNAAGPKWPEMIAAIRAVLAEWGPRAADQGRTLGIENHQDFGSRELVAFCEEAGRGVGIVFDTGNTFPVAEAPLDFTRVIAPHVCHIHLKDYRVQFTDEGFRLVRCAIGDGAVPCVEMAAILAAHHDELTAVLEPGALEARHVRCLTDAWWSGYPPTAARSFAACLAAAKVNRLADDADTRTPWERGDDAAIEAYELDMIRRSAANMRRLGLMKPERTP